MPRPPKRGLAVGWIIAIVALGMVVVVGAAVGVFALLNRGSGYDAVEGKYGAGPLASCDDFAARVGNLPPKRSDMPLQGSKGWLCTFTDEASTVTVHLDVEVTNAARQRSGFDTMTASAGYVVDPAVHLGERAAWGSIATGRSCDLIVLDSNATFKVGLDDGNAARDATQACKDRVKVIAEALYDVMQPR
ncbi:hypothetical protein [Amycolatopsis vastitatis]|uniref:DUF3558 domain-containing protein n=1 Tax=Amycolatopsis vastitatis TaxID=1905142 RepID=A0A229SRD9_9PSEU|nr:hypothetical protein [Amycolatopsis vastitatis]OXM61372.1 hypothetical protein CF165_38505 [Amycolatopsis vastitatis]